MYMYVYVCIIIICLPSVLPPSFCLPSIPPSFPSSLPPFSAGQTPLSLALGCDSTEVMNQLVRIVQDSTSRKTALHHSIKKVDRPMTGFMVWRCVYMCACVCVCVWRACVHVWVCVFVGVWVWVCCEEFQSFTEAVSYAGSPPQPSSVLFLGVFTVHPPYTCMSRAY